MKNKTNRLTSIARKINLAYWRRMLMAFALMDLVLGGFLVYACLGGLFAAPKWGFLKWLILAVLGLEAILLLTAFFDEYRARKHMEPLYEMAVRMEELSRAPFSPQKMEHMEQVISGLDTDNPGARITTGDAELKGLEMAINNMLERMRESHRQQDRFVSDASHELRTPIAVIQGYVNMLDRWGKEDPKVLDESIEALKNESEHMKTLIEQLLFLARGDSGRNKPEMKDIDLTEMVRDVFRESEMIDEKHVYELSVPEEPIPIRGDPAMLKQSLRIILENAAKYSPEGSRISLKAKLLPEGPACVVQDEGMGIEEKDVSHVFDRFYRADDARSGGKSGTGLGLSIARWIIEEHRGKIEILSRPEFGTRFTVVFGKYSPS